MTLPALQKAKAGAGGDRQEGIYIKKQANQPFEAPADESVKECVKI